LYTGQTPTTVTLQKSDGSYFGGKHYTVVIEKDGYKAGREHTLFINQPKNN
jgi:hypothetical protein